MKNTEIVIIGAGLTGLTLGFLLKRAGKNCILVEKKPYAGGVMQTKKEKGFIYETGPNTGTISNTETVKLFDYLSDKCQLEKANPKSKRRLIWKHNKWSALPSGIFPAIKTPLFTLKDKFRILGEPFRKAGTIPEETIANLVRRRLGESYLQYAVDPFVSGVYAGNPEWLVTKYALPKLYNLEQSYGSFIRGAIHKAKEHKSDLEKRVSNEVFSIKGGFSELISALSAGIGEENILTNCHELLTRKKNNEYEIIFTQNSKKTTIKALKIVSTIGAYALDRVFPFVPKELLSDIQNLEYAGIVLAVVGYNNWQGIKLDAFGGLIPSIEKRNSLGILFPSAIFTDRCPEKGALLSIFMGGTRNKKFINKSDLEIEEIVKQEISQTLNNNTEPDLIRIFRHQKAIAQYGDNTQKRLNAIIKIEKAHENLFLCGNIKDGVGIANRISQSFKIAEKLL